MSPKRSTSIFPLLWVMLFDHTSLNMTFPILTLLFFDLQSSLFSATATQADRSMWYGLCVAVPHIINIIMTPFLSALSDVFGRKKILIIGTIGAFLFAITAAIGILWGLLSLLFLGRFIQGAFSRTNPIAQAVIGDISPSDKKVRYMGYLQLSISIGAFIGPIIGGYFANRFFFSSLNFSLPYFIAALFAAISLILTLWYFQETLPNSGLPSETRRRIPLRNIKKILLKPDVLAISSILLLSQVSWSIYYQFMPPILKTVMGFESNSLGLFVGLIAFWLAVATSIGIKGLEYFLNFRQMLSVALYLVFIGLLISISGCFFPQAKIAVYLMWLSAIPVAIGDVIAYSCLTSLYSDVVEKQEQGQVMGVCSVIVAITWSLTGLLGGVLMSGYKILPLIISPLGILIAIILFHLSSTQSLLKCRGD